MIWTREKVITDLINLNKTLGHSPSTRETHPTLYQASRRNFGSFNQAKKEAGLKIFPQKHHYLRKGANILSNDLAYILGVIEGDGYCKKVKSPRRVSATIILKVKDFDFIQAFADAIRNWSGIEPRFGKDKERFFVALYSVDAVDIVQKLTLNRITKQEKSIKSNFLRGLFDSDGGVAGFNLNRRRQAARWIHFSNSDKKLINIVDVLLKDFGIDCKIRSRVHSGFGSTKLQYELFIYRLENFEKFYKHIGFYIKRKNNRLLEIINSYEKYRK